MGAAELDGEPSIPSGEYVSSSPHTPALGSASLAVPGVLGRALTEAEFRAIYEAYFESVWHALRRLRVAEHDLMDGTQNVFVVVCRKYAEFQGRAQLRTWIYQICRRVASDYRRSAPVRREVATDLLEVTERADALHSAAGPWAAGSSEQTQRVELARTILDKLPENQREVFMLYELEQLSGEEIATQLDVPLGTVRSRLRLAREAFRREVKALVTEGDQRNVG
ncbi:MAG TPA: sigma-70 family RNA polymerase sigma factor [Polyangiaceae bacterium]|nr:sigma-70 family RNA polymerase sigma factor [Polyangiaceae bacterium]